VTERPRPTLIRAARLVDGTGAPARGPAAVLIEHGRIVAVDPSPVPDGVEVMDLGDVTLLPGLIDTHVHLTVGHSPWQLARFLATTHEQQILHAVESAREALFAGITTLRDCGGQNKALIPLRDMIAAGAVVGPRLLVSGSPITTTAGHMWYFGVEADNEPEVRKAVRSHIKDGVDFIKIAASGGGMTPTSNPRAAQYSVTELRAIVEEARRLGTYATAHVLATASIEAALDAGLPMLEHTGFFRSGDDCGTAFYSTDGFAYDPTLTDRIVASGTWVSQVVIGWHRALYYRADTLPPEQRALLGDELPRRAEVLSDMHRRGVRFVAGSDGMANIPAEYFATLELSVRDIGMTPLEAITHGTGLAAEAIGIGHLAGTIQPGRQADLIAVPGDPTRDVALLRRTCLVLQGGRVIRDDRDRSVREGAAA
jgi:imidazolonepropionase-like amidohydrolase